MSRRGVRRTGLALLLAAAGRLHGVAAWAGAALPTTARRLRACPLASSAGSFADDWKRRRIEELLESPRDLDVETLTDLFAPSSFLRHEQRILPDKGYGVVFRLENLLLDTRDFEQALWTIAGAELNMPAPDSKRVEEVGELAREGRLSVYFGASPTDSALLAQGYKSLLQRLGSGAVSTGYREYFREPDRGVFGFEVDVPEVADDEGPNQVSDQGSGEADPLFPGALATDAAALDALKAVQPLRGFREFADNLRSCEVACAVVTDYPRGVARKLLDAAGLWDAYFDGPSAMALVTEDDGHVTTSQSYLGAALRMERPPSIVAVFDSTPLRMVAAHDVEMRAVAVLGASSSPRFDFPAADLVVDWLDELSIINLRKLFSDRTFAWDEQLQLKLSEAGESTRNPRRKLALASAEFEPDDDTASETDNTYADTSPRPLPRYWR